MGTKRLNPQPHALSPTSSGADCNSPEFEFWMLRNPSFPQPNLLSADELFVDGVLLPLHLLSSTNKPDPPPQTQQPDPDPDPEPDPSPAITDSSSSPLSASKRWKDIFRKKNAENNNTEEKEKEKDKDKDKGKKKERRSGSSASSAELNINIWPFSRSRSAGNTGTRPKFFPGAPVTRKVNSAPCSRSNSAGESKSRKWPTSPGRAGLHVGRSSPVWQVRRGASTTSKSSEPQPLNAADKGSKKRETATGRRGKLAGSGGGSASSKARVLNLNVPMCIGYRHHLSCRSDENSAISVSGAPTTNGGASVRGSNGNNDGGSAGNLFNLRSLFTKKNIVASH